MTLLELQQQSVTRGDSEAMATRGQVLYITLPSAGAWGASYGPLPPDLAPPWSRWRDRMLCTTPLYESMWGSAVYKAITKWAARGWMVADAGKSEVRTERAQRLLHTAQQGKGWVSFISRVLRDFLLTDNGAFIEIVRASTASGSRILGLMHLDSLRCWRTGDAAYPVIYEDLLGKPHLLRDYQVLSLVDMESARTESRGTGLCAASRAYQTIYTLMCLEQYFAEKLSGNQPKEVHLINGISADQMDGALRSSDEQRKQKGFFRYRGVVAIPLKDMEATPAGYRIPIAEVPDGFDPKQERDNGYLKYANAIGVPVQDIQPLSGQGLGTGAQTIVLAEAEEGQGLAAFGKQWEHGCNEFVFPSATTFSWSTNDLRDQKQKADISKVRADVLKILLEAQVVSAPQAQQLAADWGEIPDTFLPQDETPNDELTDGEKPVEVAIDAAPDQAAALPALALPNAATKAAQLQVADLQDADVIAAAQQLAQEVRG